MNLAELTRTAVSSMASTMAGYGLCSSASPGEKTSGRVVHVQIDMLGDVSGLIIIEMPERAAVAVANAMMAGAMVVAGPDEMCLSAVGELCNQVSGGICTALSNAGAIADIRPPHTDLRAEGLCPDRAVSFPLGGGAGAVNLFVVLTRG